MGFRGEEIAALTRIQITYMDDHGFARTLKHWFLHIFGVSVELAPRHDVILSLLPIQRGGLKPCNLQVLVKQETIVHHLLF